MTIERPMLPPTRRAFINTIDALPIAAAAPAAAAQALDAELIELGARFEPLIDQYYVARKSWSGSFERDHADYVDACNALSAIHDQMEQLANAINAASVTSIEGLRVKALIAF